MKITRACLQLLVSVLVIALLVSARFDVWWGFLFLAACSLVEAAIAQIGRAHV